MKTELNIYYDEEGDFLEINIGGYTESYFKEIDFYVAERIDEKTKEKTGIAIISFKELIKKNKNHLNSEVMSLYYDDKKDYLEIKIGEVKIPITNFTKKTENFTELQLPIEIDCFPKIH